MNDRARSGVTRIGGTEFGLWAAPADDAKDVQKRNIVKIASEFLSIAASFDPMGFYEPYGKDEIAALVPEKVNEVQIRRFEMLVHNLQSSFDTYVIHGGFRFGDRKLKSLRSYFSIVFHLLQMMGRLLHFYERHLHEAGYKNTYKRVQDKLASLVDPVMLMDRTINYGLFYACHYLNSGKKLAREILNENIERSVYFRGNSGQAGLPQPTQPPGGQDCSAFRWDRWNWWSGKTDLTPAVSWTSSGPAERYRKRRLPR
jgi:hypothetical protein